MIFCFVFLSFTKKWSTFIYVKILNSNTEIMKNRVPCLPSSHFTLFLCIFLVIVSCKTIENKKNINQTPLSRYRSSFAENNISSELGLILNSVKRIMNYTSYRNYVFDEKANITLNDFNAGGLLEFTKASLITSNTVAGSALLLGATDNKITILTCAHVVAAPDTLIQYRENSDLSNNKFIRSIAIKAKQQLYVSEMPASGKLTVLATDPIHDIAFVEMTYDKIVAEAQIFPFGCGYSEMLGWGNLIYLAGYPTGQRMITHGIVSLLPEKSGIFLTDAPFNEGLSGGIAIAITEGENKPELIGIARAVAGSYSYALVPEKENFEFTYNLSVPYAGDIYVQQKKTINQGVTTIVTINQIRKFYKEHRKQMLESGHNLDKFFGIEIENIPENQ